MTATTVNCDTISLSDVMPRAFADRGAAGSQVWGARLELSRGVFYTVEAVSGAGKSSLCSFIYGLRGDYSGTIAIDGADTRGFGVGRWCDLRRGALAYLPQELRLFPELTAIDNIMVKNNLTRRFSRAEIERRLDMLGIADKADTPCRMMSVGQQQRVAIVRALCQPYSFLLLDEPVSHLDADNNALVARMIADDALSQGAAVIATSVGNRIDLAGALDGRAESTTLLL